MPSNSLASTSPGSPAPAASGSPLCDKPDPPPPLGLAEDDELEGAVAAAVLLSPDGRVIAQRRTVVGGEA